MVRPLTPGDLYPKICARLPGEKRVVRFDKFVVEEFSELHAALCMIVSFVITLRIIHIN